MTSTSKKTHKHTRISLEWGEEYSYYERNAQLRKAQDLIEHPHHKHHEGRRKH